MKRWLKGLDLTIGTWLARVLRIHVGGLMHAHTELIARKKVLVDGVYQYTDVRRVVKDKVVTTAFVNFIVAQLQTETSAFGDFKYHDSGTGTNAENASDTTLQTPTGISRVAGTQVEGSSANIYKSVATITYDGTYSITEHMIFNASSSGTGMDRSKFGAISVVITNQIEYTFNITFSAGG